MTNTNDKTVKIPRATGLLVIRHGYHIAQVTATNGMLSLGFGEARRRDKRRWLATVVAKHSLGEFANA